MLCINNPDEIFLLSHSKDAIILVCRRLAACRGRSASAPRFSYGRLVRPARTGGLQHNHVESRHRPAQSTSAEMTQTEFLVARYIASAGPIFSGEHIFGFGRVCLHEQARQISFIVPSPTTRRSILLIRFERSTSAALMAAIVCRNVLTFDPNDTIPPSTKAIDPMAAT
jgi:hypothetical protein